MMDTPFFQGYAGPVNEADGTVYNDSVLVDMSARVVTGDSNAEDAICSAVQSTQRYCR